MPLFLEAKQSANPLRSVIKFLLFAAALSGAVVASIPVSRNAADASGPVLSVFVDGMKERVKEWQEAQAKADAKAKSKAPVDDRTRVMRIVYNSQATAPCTLNEKTKVREGNCNPRNGWLMWSRTVNGRLQYVLTQDDGRSYRTAVVIYPNEKKADGRINSDEDKSNNYSIILSQLLAK